MMTRPSASVRSAAGRKAKRLAPACLLTTALLLPGAAHADGAMNPAALQAQLGAKAAQIEVLQARARDCNRLAANDYGERLRSIDDVLGRWKFIYDAAAQDVVSMGVFQARMNQPESRGGATVNSWVRASHLSTRQLHEICQRADFAGRLVAAEGEVAAMRAQLRLAGPAVTAGREEHNPAAPRMADIRLHTIPPALRTP